MNKIKVIQKIVRNMEAKWTKGTFRQWCKSHWYSWGCDPKCIQAWLKKWGIWAKRAVAARLMCKARRQKLK